MPSDAHRSAPETAEPATDDTVPDGLIPQDILTSATPVAVYGYARAKEGREDDLLREIRAITGPTQEDAGCEQYTVHTTKGDPRAFAFYERWSSGADLLAHVSQPFMQQYFAAIGELIDGELEARWLRPITV